MTEATSSALADGASAMLLMSGAKAMALGLKPLVRIKAMAVAGCDPSVMGYGPVPAVNKALSRAGLEIGDIDLFELNEAFASQSLAVMRELNINQELVNVNGGAIALGHPLGCTGAKLSVQLFDEMRKRDMKNKYGMVTMCVGTGQGAAGIFEFLN